MGKLFDIYIKSHKLSPEKDTDFFSNINDLYFRDEIQGLSVFPQHSDIDRLTHITSVTYVSYYLAKKHNADVRQTVRGAILHDLFYYDWHDSDWSHRPNGYRHPGFALKNARELCELTKIEENIIIRHMFPLTPIIPRYKESFIVSMADKYCATIELLIADRPSFRKRFEKRLGEII